VNECTAQMADTMELVRFWYCTCSFSCLGLPLCQHSAALIFAQVQVQFVTVCFSVTLTISAPTRMMFMKFDFVGFFEDMSKVSRLIKI
jgi:hypothetical protein